MDEAAAAGERLQQVGQHAPAAILLMVQGSGQLSRILLLQLLEDREQITGVRQGLAWANTLAPKFSPKAPTTSTAAATTTTATIATTTATTAATTATATTTITEIAHQWCLLRRARKAKLFLFCSALMSVSPAYHDAIFSPNALSLHEAPEVWVGG
jgi:hypothetical protein